MQRQNSISEQQPIAVAAAPSNATTAKSIRPRIADWWWKDNLQQHFYLQKMLQNHQHQAPLPDSAIPTFFEVFFDDIDDDKQQEKQDDETFVSTTIYHQRFHVPPRPPRNLQSSTRFRVYENNEDDNDGEDEEDQEIVIVPSAVGGGDRDEAEIFSISQHSALSANENSRTPPVVAATTTKRQDRDVVSRVWGNHKSAMNFAESTPSDTGKSSFSPPGKPKPNQPTTTESEKKKFPDRNHSALSLGSIGVTNNQTEWIAVPTPVASSTGVVDWASNSCVVVKEQSRIFQNQQQPQQRNVQPSPASTFATVSIQNQQNQNQNQTAVMISSPPSSSNNNNNNGSPQFPAQNFFSAAVARCLILTQELLMEHDKRNDGVSQNDLVVAVGEEENFTVFSGSISAKNKKQQPTTKENKVSVDASPFSVVKQQQQQSNSCSATPAVLTTVGDDYEEEETLDNILEERSLNEEKETESSSSDSNKNENDDDDDDCQDGKDELMNSHWSECSEAGDSECEVHAATAVENWLKEHQQKDSTTTPSSSSVPVFPTAAATANSYQNNNHNNNNSNFYVAGEIPLSQLKSEVYFRSVKSHNTAKPLGLTMRHNYISDASLYGDDDSSVYSESQHPLPAKQQQQQQLNQEADSIQAQPAAAAPISSFKFNSTTTTTKNNANRKKSASHASSSTSTKSSSSPSHHQTQKNDETQNQNDGGSNDNNNNNNNNSNNNNGEEVMDFISSAATLRSALKFALRSVARSAIEEWVGVLPALVLLPYHHQQQQQQHQNETKTPGFHHNNHNRHGSSTTSNSNGMLSSMLHSCRRNQTPEQEERLKQFLANLYSKNTAAIVDTM
jgi:hypothetical protein